MADEKTEKGGGGLKGEERLEELKRKAGENAEKALVALKELISALSRAHEQGKSLPEREKAQQFLFERTIGDEGGLPALVECFHRLSSSGGRSASEADGALEQIKDTVVSTLVEVLKNPNDPLSGKAAYFLGRIEFDGIDGKHLQELVEAARNQPQARSEIQKILEKIKAGELGIRETKLLDPESASKLKGFKRVHAENTGESEPAHPAGSSPKKAPSR